MTRFEKRLLLGLGLLILVLSILEVTAPKPTDWTPSYSRYHRTPYGASLVYQRLGDLFPEVRTVHDAPHVTAERRMDMESEQEAPVAHVFVNSHFSLDANDTDQLLAMVEQGDHVFIAAEGLGGQLKHDLNLGMDRKYGAGEDTSDIRFIGEQRIEQGVFRFARGFPGAYFTSYDTSRTRVLAVDGASHPVLLETAWGKGAIVLCSAPRAFTNHNLLKDANARFMAGAFSVLPPYPVLWDELHKVGRMENSSFIRFLLGTDALRWAWFTSLGLIGLYLLVHSRRQQRAIPVISPPRNATRELAHTIGRLYWHKADHAGLARKMIAFFKEDVRSRTYLRTFGYDGDTTAHLSTKTGLSTEETGQRLAAIQRREQATRLTEDDLLQLSTELHEFRKLIR